MQPFELKIFKEPDALFQSGHYPKPFEFNQEVAAVFDDMVLRSIPLYLEVTRLTGVWAERFYQTGTRLYDLGCSTGTTLDYLGRVLKDGAHMVGVDGSPSMVARAREKLRTFPAKHRLDLHCEDLLACNWQSASVVVMNYTLQFLPLAKRRQLLQTIEDTILPGGILILSEKVRSACPEFQEAMTGIYEDFKERQGYSASEIARKKEALEHVLVPSTEAELRSYLSAYGSVESVLKWNNFVTLIAHKTP